MTEHDRFESAYRECFPIASSMQSDLFERDDDMYIEAKVHTAFTLWKAARATPADQSDDEIAQIMISKGYSLVSDVDGTYWSRATPADQAQITVQRYSVFETQDGNGTHIVEVPCRTGKWVKFSDIEAMPTPADHSVPVAKVQRYVQMGSAMCLTVDTGDWVTASDYDALLNAQAPQPDAVKALKDALDKNDADMAAYHKNLKDHK